MPFVLSTPSFLFVQNGTGGTLAETTLTLTGVSSQTGWFTDRPYRRAGQVPTEGFLSHWDEGESSFADYPPNANFTCEVEGEVVNYVVELTSPGMAGGSLFNELDDSESPPKLLGAGQSRLEPPNSASEKSNSSSRMACA